MLGETDSDTKSTVWFALFSRYFLLLFLKKCTTLGKCIKKILTIVISKIYTIIEITRKLVKSIKVRIHVRVNINSGDNDTNILKRFK